MGTLFPFLSLLAFYFSERRTHSHGTHAHKLRDHGCLVVVESL